MKFRGKLGGGGGWLLTLVVILLTCAIMRGFTFHPFYLSVVISGSNLMYLFVVACFGYLSW